MDRERYYCVNCGAEKKSNRGTLCRRCSNHASMTPEVRERIRQSMVGVRHDAARRAANSDGQRRRTDGHRFNLAQHMAARPHPFAKPLGATYANKEGRVWIKVSDHGPKSQQWRRRAHEVWEATNGPVPRGRLLHHINEDCSDDRLENLQLVTRAQHAAIHATPEKQRAAQLLGVAARKRNRPKY